MHHLKSITLVAALSLSAAAQAQVCSFPSTNEIVDPQTFAWESRTVGGADPHFFGTMEMVEETLTIGADEITTRVYQQAGAAKGTIPGPTLVMEPGNKYVLRFHNRLPYQPPSPEHNVFKDPNISNLHTHGLHISGETPSDDVTRSFEGGTYGDFVYDIPADHMGGTYWYHAHHHGSTFLQVSAGAFGLIVIDDSGDVGVPQNVRDMAERQLVVAYLDPAVAGTGGDTLIQGSLAPTWTVNGRIAGDLCVPPDTWQHWRLLLADRDAKLKTVSVGPSCEVVLLARDGVWRTEAPKLLDSNSLDLTGASRADLAVRCSGSSTLSVGNEVVANLVVDNGLQSDPGPSPWNNGIEGFTWFAERPVYLQDLRGVPTNQRHRESVNMGARTINGSKFDHHVPTFVLGTDKVQDWTLKGATNHPFHLHVYHVQVQGNCGEFEDGEYYDVVAGNCNIRFDLRQQAYEGRTIMHCHILQHEDQGAMGWADVVGGFAPPTFPGGENTPYTFKFDTNDPGGDAPAAPQALTATAISDTAIDLLWTDASSNEDGFHVERSPDGAGWTNIVSLGPNSEFYQDTGLEGLTQYFYRVLAFNANGQAASETVSETTLSPSTATLVRVRSITVSTVDQGKGQKAGRAVVVAEDDTGATVANAVVTGVFSGSYNQTLTGTTDGTGTAGFDSTTTVKGKVNFDFCVTSIVADGLTDFHAENGQACGSL